MNDGALNATIFSGGGSKDIYGIQSGAWAWKDESQARIVRQLQELPGQELFQYVDDDGERRVVESGDVNAYVNAANSSESRFTAKDFRTWGGTCEAVCVLREMGPPDDEKEAEANIVELYKRVAECLGNTPAVCKEYYVHPAIATAYRQGVFFNVYEQVEKAGAGEDEEWLDVAERVSLELLRLARE